LEELVSIRTAVGIASGSHLRRIDRNRLSILQQVVGSLAREFFAGRNGALRRASCYASCRDRTSVAA
jgi:hypothetical protein